jgi:hypothetical protein
MQGSRLIHAHQHHVVRPCRHVKDMIVLVWIEALASEVAFVQGAGGMSTFAACGCGDRRIVHSAMLQWALYSGSVVREADRHAQSLSVVKFKTP